jgi:hypothetical protein
VTAPDVDYHHEKYAVVALGHYLMDVEGWSSVQVSVALKSLDAPGGLRGRPLPSIDGERDRADRDYRYNFYVDTGGIDLVATKPGHTLLVEAKGKSIPVNSGIEQLVGRTILSMEPGCSDRSYAILIPDLPRWLRAVETARNPVLSDIRVYAVSPKGAIRRCDWGAPATEPAE